MNANNKVWRNKLVEILRTLSSATKSEMAAALVLGKVGRRGIQRALAEASATSFVKGARPSGETLTFYYESETGNKSRRTVVPIRIYQHTTRKGDTNWYMEAWCLQNHNYRTYRLDHLNVGTPDGVAAGMGEAAGG